MDNIRILIADDHAILREGIKALLSTVEGLEVVGEAEDGNAVIGAVAQLRPDIVLMDIAMPGLGGLEATIEVATKTKVIVLTQFENVEYIYRFFKAGARGFVLKKALGKELVAAIHAVYKGEKYIDPSITSEVLEGYLSNKEKQTIEDPYESLTDREKQVFKLLAEGCTSKEIANMLNISVKTVMAHRSNIMDKMNTHNRTDLIKLAIAKGVI